MVRFAGTDNGGGDRRRGEQPGERNLRTGHAALFGNLAQAIDHLAIVFFSAGIHGVAEAVGFGTLGRFGLPGAGEAPAGDRAPGHDADAFGEARAGPFTSLLARTG